MSVFLAGGPVFWSIEHHLCAHSNLCVYCVFTCDGQCFSKYSFTFPPSHFLINIFIFNFAYSSVSHRKGLTYLDWLSIHFSGCIFSSSTGRRDIKGSDGVVFTCIITRKVHHGGFFWMLTEKYLTHKSFRSLFKMVVKCSGFLEICQTSPWSHDSCEAPCPWMLPEWLPRVSPGTGADTGVRHSCLLLPIKRDAGFLALLGC